MIRLYCDRCGCEIKAPYANGNKTPTANAREVYAGYLTMWPLDLCQECFKELDKWLEEGKE